MRTARYVTKIWFAEANRERLESGRMRAVLVRDRTAKDIDPMLALMVGGGKVKEKIGNGLVTDMQTIQVYGHKMAKLGNGPMVDLKGLRVQLRDLGLGQDEFYTAITPGVAWSGVVVWFDFEPLPVPV